VTASRDDGIVWCDPPTTRGKGVWERCLVPLIEKPGQWARVAVKETMQAAYSCASSLSRRKVKLPPGRWEFAARHLPDDPKRGGVWARYLGPDE
jgi:hypothetical protein